MAGGYIAVIAIDFGTTFSGYAFSMKSSKDDIKMNKSWGAEVGFRGYKTPTTVLTRPDGSLHAFGFEAENEFADMDEEDISEGYQLFQRFKMELYGRKHLDASIKIKSSSGEERSALDIFAHALRYLKTHSMNAMAKPLAQPIAQEYIRWVITVPAIWNDTAKKFMRLAAKKAGLVDDMISPNLIIALEPEAASLYCRTLAMEDFIGMGHVSGKMSVKAGDTYIIVDCGGGTIDITIHEVLSNGKVREVKEASGGPWGGIYVDKKFHELLDDVFGKDFMNHLKHDHPSVWLSMLVDFETKKRAANPDTSTGVNLVMSLQFAKSFEEKTGKDAIGWIKSKKHLGVKYSNGMLRIASETVEGMYSEVIPKIKSHLKGLLRDSNARNISKMFVVGGFGESAFIQEALNSEFGHRVQILIPDEAGMCVMKGAVMFGHDTESIDSRVAQYYYCVRSNRTPKEGDDPSRIRSVKGEGNAIRYLMPFINKGDQMKIDKNIEHTLHPLQGDVTSVRLCLYATEENTDDPEHATATKLEDIVVESPDISKGTKRNIHVTLRFGGTDILFKAVDEESGHEAKSTIHI